jgi:hypothetical protein
MMERSETTSPTFSRGADLVSSPSFVTDQEKSELDYHLSTGATPLAGAEYPDVKKMQEVVRQLLLKRTEDNAFDDIPEELKSFMIDCFSNRFNARALKNYESYVERLNYIDPSDMSDEFHDQYERSMRGLASPESLIIVRRTLGMKAIELARATTSYGAMVELLEPMREEVGAAIKRQGGIVLDSVDYQDKFKIRTADLLVSPDDHEEMMGLLVTRRRNVGLLDDDTLVMERSSFVIPTYEGGAYDPELSRAMRRVKLANNPDAIQQLHEAGRIDSVVPQLIQAQDFRAAMPQSTTIFAFNKTTDQQIKERNVRQKPRRAREYMMSMTRKEPNFRPGDIKEMTERLDAEG